MNKHNLVQEIAKSHQPERRHSQKVLIDRAYNNGFEDGVRSERSRLMAVLFADPRQPDDRSRN